jgi:hypothetical protein
MPNAFGTVSTAPRHRQLSVTASVFRQDLNNSKSTFFALFRFITPNLEPICNAIGVAN